MSFRIGLGFLSARVAAPAMVLALVGALTACHPKGDESRVRLLVRIPDENKTKGPLKVSGSATVPAGPVDFFDVEIKNRSTGDVTQVRVSNDFSLEGMTSIDGGVLKVAPGPDWVVTLTGLDRSGGVYSIGRSQPFEVPKKGSVEVRLVLGIADDFVVSKKTSRGLGQFISVSALPNASVLLLGREEGQLGANVYVHNLLTGELCGRECLSGDVPSARSFHVAQVLGDGRVFIAGGLDTAGRVLADAYVFDPAARQFAKVDLPGLPGRYGAASALVGPGKVLIAGGRSAGADQDSIRVFLVDVETRAVAQVGDLPRPVFLAAATALANGNVLVSGGFEVADGGVGREVAEAVLFGAGGSQVSSPLLKTPRAAHTATALLDGTALIYGGESDGGTFVSMPEIFSADLGQFRPLPEPAWADSARAGHAAVRLETGDVLIIGGDRESTEGTNLHSTDVIRFTPVGGGNGAFSAAGKLTYGRTGVSAALLSDSSVVVAGGGRSRVDSDLPLEFTKWDDSIEVFTPCAVRDRPCAK